MITFLHFSKWWNLCCGQSCCECLWCWMCSSVQGNWYVPSILCCMYGKEKYFTHTVCTAECTNNTICDSDGTNCRCKEGYGAPGEDDCCNCAVGNVTHGYYKINGTCKGKIKLVNMHVARLVVGMVWSSSFVTIAQCVVHAHTVQ